MGEGGKVKSQLLRFLKPEQDAKSPNFWACFGGFYLTSIDRETHQ